VHGLPVFQNAGVNAPLCYFFFASGLKP